MAGQVNAWLTAVDALPEITERLKRVQILCEPAGTAIKRVDHEDALIYCDPPYLHATRTVKKAYACEMTDEDHRELARTLRQCKAKVILSGYPSELYEELYRDWRCVGFDVAAHSARVTKPRRRECLWMNW